MADDEASGDEGDDEQSFQERVEELREQRAEGGGDPREAMGGGPPGGMGGGPGGNPFAQMMGGMMGGGPGAMGGGPGGGGGIDDETFTREMQRLRDVLREATDELERIAEALEDD
jgi:hypothetical protein